MEPAAPVSLRARETGRARAEEPTAEAPTARLGTPLPLAAAATPGLQVVAPMAVLRWAAARTSAGRTAGASPVTAETAETAEKAVLVERPRALFAELLPP